MKNKILIIFLILYSFISKLNAKEFLFDAKNILITNNGNLITANNGTAISSDKNIQIKGHKFEYNKIQKILRSFNSVTYLKKKNLKINSNKVFYDEINSILIAEGDVEIFDQIKNYTILSDGIILDLNNNIIKSDFKTILKDKFNNKLISKNFNHNLTSSILKLEEVEFFDSKKNYINIDIAYVNFDENKLIGKDININLTNESFNKKNDPRLKGRSAILNENKAELTKAVFTLCEKNDNCPPWELSAEKIIHDKDKKIITYSNAWLKIYDLPLVYFPKFFHPDPTVERQSGFLMPTIKNSPNKTSYLSIPYYHVLNDNKDITFTPRLFNRDKLLLQTEFRQVNKNSSHMSDVSFLTETNKNNKNHFFYNYERKFDFQNFSENNLNIKLQQTNNDTYLKGNNIKTFLSNNYDVLETSVNLDLYSENILINSNLILYEDLNKNSSDKYEYILPKINLIKNFNTNYNGDLKLISNSHIKNYDTNVQEKININDLIFTSNPKITKYGFYNNQELILKNSNSSAKNSSNFKNENNIYLSGLYQFNSSLPMVNKSKNYKKILKPKFSLKLSPQNDKNINNEEFRMDANNIFNLNRLTSNETIEGGISLAYGNEFSISNLNNSKEIFSINLANNIRLKENDNLPKSNQLGGKTSNFFGEATFSPNDIITTKYNLSVKNNLQEISYENLIAQINLNKFVTTFDYLNENNTIEKNSYLLTTAKYNLDDTNSLSLSTRENKTSKLTEYYNLAYQYKNDCLAASLEYNKTYYSDRDIKPDESIFFKLTIIPFGETSSPNLFK